MNSTLTHRLDRTELQKYHESTCTFDFEEPGGVRGALALRDASGTGRIFQLYDKSELLRCVREVQALAVLTIADEEPRGLFRRQEFIAEGQDPENNPDAVVWIVEDAPGRVVIDTKMAFMARQERFDASVNPMYYHRSFSRRTPLVDIGMSIWTRTEGGDWEEEDQHEATGFLRLKQLDEAVFDVRLDDDEFFETHAGNPRARADFFKKRIEEAGLRAYETPSPRAGIIDIVVPALDWIPGHQGPVIEASFAHASFLDKDSPTGWGPAMDIDTLDLHVHAYGPSLDPVVQFLKIDTPSLAFMVVAIKRMFIVRPGILTWDWCPDHHFATPAGDDDDDHEDDEQEDE